MDRVAQFHDQRPRLLALAYRMLGGVSDAEDVVQDAWLRWSRSEVEVATPAAYLRSVVTRLCIDRMRALKSRRETYVGAWLPEPVPDDLLEGTGEEAQALAESLRIGVLLVLERLSPIQRAVFVLRELLDCDYAEIAAAVGRNATTCRQVFLRARARLGESMPARAVPRGESEAVIGAFLGALAARDLPRLTALLAEEATLVADHGGKAQASRRTVLGADAVGRMLHGLTVKYERDSNFSYETMRLSGGTGLLMIRAGVVVAAITFTVADGRIAAVHTMRNPDKLRHLQRLASAERADVG